MRALASPPAAVVDPDSAAINAGSFCGGLPPVDMSPLSPGLLYRAAKHKRWVYVAIAAGEIYVGLAIVRLGYIANAFAFVFDGAEHRLLADHAALGPPFGATVSDAAPAGYGPVATAASSLAVARFSGARLRVERARGETAVLVEVEMGSIRLFATLEGAGAPPAIAAIGAVAGAGAESVNATEKRALLAVKGEASVGDRRIPLDGGLGGYDYTNGLLPRHTTWRWAFALGRARTGERIGLNLVEGMTGETECALWVEGALFPLAEGRFAFDAARPLEPWGVRTADGAVDLRFTPGGMHADRTNLGIVRSRFVQPAGTYAGTIRTPEGRVLELDGVLGVTEDQDVLW